MNYAEHNINLIFRFLLELAALTGYGYWGWQMGTGWLRLVLVVVLPLASALVWGTFAVPDDPSRSGKTPIAVPGWLRLILEFVIFGLASWAWLQAGKPVISLALALLVLLHYFLSADRIRWLFQQEGK